jgi:hypothetical protein
MKTIETTGTVQPDGTLTIQVPPDIQPGEHRIVLVIDEQPAVPAPRSPLNFPVDHYGSWLANVSLRREDMYDDWGR